MSVPSTSLSTAGGAKAADTAIEAAARLLLAPCHAYAHALEKHPLLTKACTRFAVRLQWLRYKQLVSIGTAWLCC